MIGDDIKDDIIGAEKAGFMVKNIKKYVQSNMV